MCGNTEDPGYKRTGKGIIIPNFKLYLRGIVIKTAWHWIKKKEGYIGRCNRLEDYMWIHTRSWFLAKRPKIHVRGKGGIFSNWGWSKRLVEKKETRSVSLTLYILQLQMDKRPYYKTWNLELNRIENREYAWVHLDRKEIFE